MYLRLFFKVIILNWLIRPYGLTGWVTKNIDFKTLHFVINKHVSIINTIQYNTIHFKYEPVTQFIYELMNQFKYEPMTQFEYGPMIQFKIWSSLSLS